MKRIILIVEDYEDSRLFLKLLLEMNGYETLEAADGLEAIEIYRTNCPDLSLMDISMPVMDGLTATKNIRTIKRSVRTPIIAVTANGKEIYDKVIAAGCNAMIEKPVEFDSLEAVIHQYLAP